MPAIVINCAYSFAVLMEDMREMYIGCISAGVKGKKGLMERCDVECLRFGGL